MIALLKLMGGRARAFPLLVLIATTATPAAERAGDSDRPGGHEIEAASARALDWIETHRATPEDGGLPDMIDEGVSFRVFRDLSPTPSDREHFAHLFRSQMAAINDLPEFERWVSATNKPLIEHYHLVLAARLTQLAGQTSPLTPLIMEQAQRALATAAFENPTVRLTTALFLSRLGTSGAKDIDALLEHSLIEQLARDCQFIRLPTSDATAYQRRAATWLLYALVHEVVALTDFGRLQPSPWLAARRDVVAGVLLDALPWASAGNNMDLTAELAMTLFFLGQPLGAQLRSALDDLLSQQQADGSWGASTTTARQNKVRHTVLTSAAALLAYRAWRERDEKHEDKTPEPVSNSGSRVAGALRRAFSSRAGRTARYPEGGTRPRSARLLFVSGEAFHPASQLFQLRAQFTDNGLQALEPFTLRHRRRLRAARR